MEKFALIVAGGIGTRMGTDVPKQFLELAGRPILMRTMERFAAFDPAINLVLVLPAEQFDLWNQLCNKFRFNLKHELAVGGVSRFQSVKNGLAKLPDEGLVFIHDGVRPLVSFQTIRNCQQATMEKGNALPVMPLVESLRELENQQSSHVERDRFRLVQTPQTFLIHLVKRAYMQPESSFFTDDASVCEALGATINLVDGNSENIKITRPIDMKIAECLLAASK